MPNPPQTLYHPVMAHPKTAPGFRVPPDLMEPTAPAERERLLIEAEAEIEAGHGPSHADVMAWLRDMAAGRVSPPPCDR